MNRPKFKIESTGDIVDVISLHWSPYDVKISFIEVDWIKDNSSSFKKSDVDGIYESIYNSEFRGTIIL